MTRKHYELQVKHPSYGWVSAGNFDTYDEKEGRRSLEAFRKPWGAPRTYRLVELVPREIARVRSRKDDGCK